MSTYSKKWFLEEDDAKGFAEKMNGKVYDAEFIGGYHVMYPSPEKELKVAIESTKDYTDTEFHKNLVDVHIQNKDGTYGKVVDSYRLVCINENGLLTPFNEEVFTSAEAAKEAVQKREQLTLINYDDLVHESIKVQNEVIRMQKKRKLPLDQRLAVAKGALINDIHQKNKAGLMERVDTAKGAHGENKRDFEKNTEKDLTL